jgi:DMSO/TMAO reductase YedYZ heme-binding membrane subunit
MPFASRDDASTVPSDGVAAPRGDGTVAEAPPASNPDAAIDRRQPPRRRARSGWRQAVAVNAAAIVVVCALFGWVVWRSHEGTNVVGLQMPAMDLEHRVGYWWPFLMGQALGLAALAWSYLSVLLGLLFSSRRPRRLGLSSRRINALHRHLSLTAIALILGHALFVALSSMNEAMTERIVDFSIAFLPFQSAFNEWPYAYGILAMYLALLLGPTYYLRGRLGERGWRVAHRLSLAVYVLAVLHTFAFSDYSLDGAYRLGLWIAQIPLGALLLWRLAAPLRRPGRSPGEAPRLRWTGPGPSAGVATRLGLGAVTAACLIALVVVVASGRIGGAPPPVDLASAASATRLLAEPAGQKLQIDIAPLRAGNVALHVYLTGPRQPTIDSLTMTAASPRANTTVAIYTAGPAHAMGQTRLAPGIWTFRVRGRDGGHRPLSGSFRVTIR